MSKAFPTPWTFEAGDDFEDSPIRAANGERVLVRDNGVYPPDLETCREIVDAVNAVDAVLKFRRTLLGWGIERGRLRDIVRRLVDEMHHCHRDLAGEMSQKLMDAIYEARDVIGEGGGE